MSPRLDAVVVADDLTGAADTGVLFGALGLPIYLLPMQNLPPAPDWTSSACGISLYTDTRQLSAQAAAKRLKRVVPLLSELNPRRIYKKIDSCLRGNPGAEIDVLLDVLGFDAALVAPALPSQGRSTIGSVHLVHGIPLAKTELARDPVTPVTCSKVTDVLLRQSRYPVGRIDVSEYSDPDRMQSALQRERRRGCRLIACDAANQIHLDQVAALVAASGGRLLPVGSAGLAASLVKQLRGRSMTETMPVPILKRLLMVCGTGSQVTRNQLDALSNRHPALRRKLEPQWLSVASRRDLRRRATELTGAWTEGLLALQMAPLSPKAPGVPPREAAAGLAKLALQIIRGQSADGIFLSGGETAHSFLCASGALAMRLEREILPGLVLGRWLGGAADGLPVVTKAGAFGDDRTLIALYERLCGETTS